MSGFYPSDALLSVVVIGRNEGARLVRCFESLEPLKKMAHGAEIIYVDSASTDGSIKNAEAFGAKVVPLNSEFPSASAARNAGWRVAKGNYILFLDGDTILHPDFVNEALPLFVEPDIAIICGHRREAFPQESRYNYVFDRDWIYPVGDVPFCGGDALVRKKVLEEVGGYNDALIAGEEPEMCQRIRKKGHRIIRVDKLMTYHDLHIMNFGQYWKRCFRTGYAYAEIAHRQRYRQGALWVSESLHNAFKGVLLLGLMLFSVIGLYWSWRPLLFTIFFLFLLTSRTAVLARPKSDSWLDSVVYGIHAHFQHIPMFFGQLSYWKDCLQGKTRPIIEYK